MIESETFITELEKLEDLRVPPQGSERRRAQRFVVRSEALITGLGYRHADDQPLPIHLRDISREGVGFLCGVDLPLGSTQKIVFLERGYPIAQQAMIVRRCDPVRPGIYLVGGQFCIDIGTLILLGIDPRAIHDDGDASAELESPIQYLGPKEMA